MAHAFNPSMQKAGVGLCELEASLAYKASFGQPGLFNKETLSQTKQNKTNPSLCFKSEINFSHFLNRPHVPLKMKMQWFLYKRMNRTHMQILKWTLDQFKKRSQNSIRHNFSSKKIKLSYNSTEFYQFSYIIVSSFNRQHKLSIIHNWGMFYFILIQGPRIRK